MAKARRSRDLVTLIKATENSRKQLNEAWKKVENLQAAIDSAKKAQDASKAWRPHKIKPESR